MLINTARTSNINDHALLDAPKNGGAISTLIDGPTAALFKPLTGGRWKIEHRAGHAEVLLQTDPSGQIQGAGTLRIARKLFSREAFAAGAQKGIKNEYPILICAIEKGFRRSHRLS